MNKKMIIGYSAAGVSAFFWGIHAVIIRILINQGVDPILIAALRLYIGAGVIALVLLIWKGLRKEKALEIVYSRLFWIITASLAVNFVLFQKGLEFTIASNAVLLEAFAPVMVLILALLFLPQRVAHLTNRYRGVQKILQIVIIGSIGSSLLLINDPQDLLSTNENKLIGDLLEFIAMFAFALFIMGVHEYHTRFKSHNALLVSSQIFIFAAILITPFAMWNQLPSITSMQWFWITMIGIFSTGVAYVAWHIASKYLDIIPLITIFNLVSIFTIISESLVLGLNISWKLIVGSILILFAAYQAKILNAEYRLIEKEESITS
ncbi:hypothetical protein COV82_03440 [Candidatus Peregrinibacteria bacterium CG11_big_fil_rev_8_21_14_0_20_46_8]|nr:MAG: hypothetical protein COV82_03440 [Candidatus Peregrinibacteria bacterium CG11_big_fil_rev_8_21_14_0_20_46_8]